MRERGGEGERERERERGGRERQTETLWVPQFFPGEDSDFSAQKPNKEQRGVEKLVSIL